MKDHMLPSIIGLIPLLPLLAPASAVVAFFFALLSADGETELTPHERDMLDDVAPPMPRQKR